MMHSILRAAIEGVPDSYTTIRAQFRRDVYGIVSAYLDDTGARVTFYRNRFRDALEESCQAAFYRGYLDSGGEETEREDEAWLSDAVTEQVDFGYSMFDALREARKGEAPPTPDAEGAARSEVWAVTLDGFYSEGRARGDKNQMLTFRLNPDKEPSMESCADCQYYLDQRHSAGWWLKRDLIRRPNDNYECQRFKCPHDHYTDTDEKWTR